MWSCVVLCGPTVCGHVWSCVVLCGCRVVLSPQLNLAVLYEMTLQNEEALQLYQEAATDLEEATATHYSNEPPPSWLRAVREAPCTSWDYPKLVWHHLTWQVSHAPEPSAPAIECPPSLPLPPPASLSPSTSQPYRAAPLLFSTSTPSSSSVFLTCSSSWSEHGPCPTSA